MGKLINIVKSVLVFLAIGFNTYNILEFAKPRIAKAYKTKSGIDVVIKIKQDTNPNPQLAEAQTIILPKSPKEEFDILYKKRIIRGGKSIAGDINKGKVSEQTLKTFVELAKFTETNSNHLDISCLASGNSYQSHRSGHAFDVSNEQIAKIVVPWLFDNRDSLKIKELIFNSSLIGVSANHYNLYNGKPHKYNSGTVRQHSDHIHVAIY